MLGSLLAAHYELLLVAALSDAKATFSDITEILLILV